MSEDQDWRLRAELDSVVERGALDRLIGRVRGPDVEQQLAAAVADDVVVTHDGKLLFAYAATEAALQSARSAIESVLSADGIGASITISRWEDETEQWRQVDPPLTGEAKEQAERAERDAEAIETRTMVASAGRMVRKETEQIMLNAAAELHLRCEITEHPHLLTSQVAFTVTGPKGKIDEFARALQQEELATLRIERAVMISPL